jgi:two-component system, NarL family, sensor kinase
MSFDHVGMTRPFPTHFFILILAGLLWLPAVAFVGLHLATPFDNGRLQPGSDNITAEGVIVTPLEDGPAGFEAGDLVTAVNGRSLESYAQALFSGRPMGSQRQVGDTITYTVRRDGQLAQVSVTLAPYPLAAIVRQNWGTILFALLFTAIGAIVFARRPRQASVQLLFLSAASILSATTWSLGLQIGDFVNGTGFWLYKVTALGAYMLYWIAGFHFALLFPRPLPWIERRRRLLPAVYLLPYLLMAGFIAVVRPASAGTLDWIGRWTVAEGMHAALFLGLTLLTIGWQYRRSRDGVTRRQMRWVVWAALLSGGGGLLFYILPGVAGAVAVDPNVIGLIVLPFPLAIAIAILRHNLFDIDRLINRTLVYGALTTVIISLYILIVGSLSVLFQAQGNLLISLLATAVVAVLFQPLRDWLQQRVNRFTYGDRDQPFDVLARLGQRLENTLSPQETLPALVATIAEALRLPYVAIAVESGKQKEEGKRQKEVVAYGKPVQSVTRFPLAYQGQPVGELWVALRAADEPFTRAELHLLHNIARQAGTAVYAVQLTEQLRRSRQRLVTAREEERRRLRRDLHDGLGPTLAAHLLKIGSARELLARDPATAARLLTQLEDGLAGTLEEIRRLVYDLRPPVLDQLGLVGAVQACAAEYERPPSNGEKGLAVTVTAPDALPLLPAAVEVAAYRIAQEALHNVSRHARASRCTVTLRPRNGALWLEVRDDGLGLPPNGRAGVGLQSMKERAAELNGRCVVESLPTGGTRVTAELPLG